MKRLSLTAGLLVSLALAASASAHVRITLLESHAAVRAQTLTLVDATGRAIGGYLQSWTNSMHVEHRSGTLMIDPNSSICRDWHDGTDICAGIDPVGTIYWPTSWADGIHTRYTFFHEMGHEFDAQYLTDADHARLLPLLSRYAGHQLQLSPWLNMTATTHGAEADSAGEWFADAYSACAFGEPESIAAGPQICAYVQRIGLARH